MNDLYSFAGTFWYGYNNCSRHLHIEKRDQAMNDVPDTRLGSRIRGAGRHVASIKQGMHCDHESESGEPDVVGRDVYTNTAKRDRKECKTKDREHAVGQI